jgi:ribonuclease-3
MGDPSEPELTPGELPARPALPDPVDALEAALGLRFPDRQVALSAVTHKSYANEHRDEAAPDNERLEFLGDAVIDLAVSHRLMDRFPRAREGELSKMRASVVDEQGLADMARALDLGSLLRLGRGEELTGGRRKASLLADAMEAVVAAVYLAAGLEPVLSLVDRFLGGAFARASEGTLDRDFKTQLQEVSQSRLRASPRYRVVAEVGPDHEKTFEVEVDLRGELLGRGSGRSKKDAEQAAAKVALEAVTRRDEAGGPAPAAGPGAPGVVAVPAEPGPAGPATPEAAPEVAEPAAKRAATEGTEPARPTRRPKAAAERRRKPAKRRKAAPHARRAPARPGSRRKR